MLTCSGVRGVWGNFGIVTEFEFRLHPLGPQVVAGPVFWPIDDAPNVLRFYRDWIADSPDDLMTLVTERRALRSKACLPISSGSGARRRVLLRRLRRGRWRRWCGCSGVQLTSPRSVRAEAVRRAPADVRRELRERVALLLPFL